MFKILPIYFVINLSIEVFYLFHGATSILDGLVLRVWQLEPILVNYVPI